MKKVNFQTHHVAKQKQHMDFNHEPLKNFTKQELFDYMNKELAEVKDDEKIESVKGMLLFTISSRVLKN